MALHNVKARVSLNMCCMPRSHLAPLRGMDGGHSQHRIKSQTACVLSEFSSCDADQTFSLWVSLLLHTVGLMPPCCQKKAAVPQKCSASCLWRMVFLLVPLVMQGSEKFLLQVEVITCMMLRFLSPARASCCQEASCGESALRQLR